MRDHLLATEFIESHFYDVRATGNSRWIDQKCAYDVVNFVADCIVFHLEETKSEVFEAPQVWRSEYAVQFVQEVFGKPYPLDESPHDEFNKFFRQPPKMLAAAGVFDEARVRGNTIQFSVKDWSMLEFIAMRPWNALVFSQAYIEKTLRDSGLWHPFEFFFAEQSRDAFDQVKRSFREFCFRYTPINTAREANRIFPKVLNPLALKFHTRGAVLGRLSKSVITPDEVAYNRPNWRDVGAGKDKNISRRDYEIASDDSEVARVYMVRKQKKLLRQFNDAYRNSKSEVIDLLAAGEPATQAHHIFPQSKFPGIADCRENIIMLTSAQHFEKAHPNGNTSEVNLEYQLTCLKAKVRTIRENLEGDIDYPPIYDFDSLVHVLNVGFATDAFSGIANGDFDAIEKALPLYYSPNAICRIEF